MVLQLVATITATMASGHTLLVQHVLPSRPTVLVQLIVPGLCLCLPMAVLQVVHKPGASMLAMCLLCAVAVAPRPWAALLPCPKRQRQKENVGVRAKRQLLPQAELQQPKHLPVPTAPGVA